MKNTTITVTVNNGLVLSGSPEDVAMIIASLNGCSIKSEKPKKELRSDYTNKSKGFDNFVVNVDKSFVSFAHKDGTYFKEGFYRKALNNRAKAAGAKWDKEARKWAFTSAKKAQDFAKTCTAGEALDAEVEALIKTTNEKNASKAV